MYLYGNDAQCIGFYLNFMFLDSWVFNAVCTVCKGVRNRLMKENVGSFCILTQSYGIS